MDEVRVNIEVEVNATEDREKVERAVENIFGSVDFKVNHQNRRNFLVVKAKGVNVLTTLSNLLRRERIRDAARRVLFEGLRGKSITFYLNKQVAYVGHLSFAKPVGESPLGPIKVQISCDNPIEVIRFLAPKT